MTDSGNKAVFVVRDIDAQKQTEAALKASELQFRSLFENNHAVMLLIDPDKLDIIDANPAAVSFYGYAYEQLIEMKISDINLLTVEQLHQETAKAKAAEKIRFEFQHRLANGVIKDVEVFSGLVKAPDKPYLYSIIHDITDRKEAEIKLNENSKALHELNLTKDKLFSVIAHDLRNPVGLMLNLVEMYTEEKDDYTEEEKSRMLKAMHKTAANTYELLENLLAWSRLQRKHITPVFQQLGLHEHVTYCLANFESAAANKQLIINNNVPKNFEVQLDLNIFEIVFRNLLSNAIKFSNPGQSIALNAAFDQEKNLIFRVKDHGVGMNKTLVDGLFSLDNDTGRPGTAGEKSTGLGLVICKDMMNLINGRIEVESMPGKGTTFTLTMPQPKT
jgi:PAS domain S-box-containing protein